MELFYFKKKILGWLGSNNLLPNSLFYKLFREMNFKIWLFNLSL